MADPKSAIGMKSELTPQFGIAASQVTSEIRDLDDLVVIGRSRQDGKMRLFTTKAQKDISAILQPVDQYMQEHNLKVSQPMREPAR